MRTTTTTTTTTTWVVVGVVMVAMVATAEGALWPRVGMGFPSMFPPVSPLFRPRGLGMQSFFEDPFVASAFSDMLVPRRRLVTPGSLWQQERLRQKDAAAQMARVAEEMARAAVKQQVKMPAHTWEERENGVGLSIDLGSAYKHGSLDVTVVGDQIHVHVGQTTPPPADDAEAPPTEDDRNAEPKMLVEAEDEHDEDDAEVPARTAGSGKEVAPAGRDQPPVVHQAEDYEFVFCLPENARQEEISAKFIDGRLSIDIPIAPTQPPAPRRIAIQ
eukprot:CAMPEP_0119120040 /NCGR_PEP_ID=MMETSP1310-20130426/1263_1 /TAXON_ID=464262 /ORGANISM="Genus nov. species nov., Strain RCC2339" /LENGTH=272 /DNA_ID=CAMNT_0007109503 /DNA_START=140 /DNA_END=958 /DNA_ORIENTATION=+